MGDRVWQVPEEVPIAVLFNSQNYAVMMGTMVSRTAALNSSSLLG